MEAPSTQFPASTHSINGLLVTRQTTKSGSVELQLCPEALAGQRVQHRSTITGLPECRATTPNIIVPDNMVQLKLTDDNSAGGFLNGMTMQDSDSVRNLKCEAKESDFDGETLVTTFTNDAGLLVQQTLVPTPVPGSFRSWTTVTNNGSEPISLEHLTSFVLSGVTPFAADDAPGRLRLHRFRSWWSNEGRHENQLLEDLHLQRSWSGFGPVSERFGQVGTMPVRKYFPFIAIEDTEAGVLWGAQLAWAGSWQMEATRRADLVSISGGLADYEFGHWRKTLQPGESITSPEAYLACVAGTIDDLTATLVATQEALLPEPPEVEKDLPVIFNEWCTNWGAPSHDKTIALAKRLQGTGVKYIVIDDGWAVRPPEATMQSNGDWVVETKKFPHGIKATCEAIRDMGFIPGVWFEYEVCNPGSKAFEQKSHHLQRNGKPLRVGSRHFWDLNDPWVVDYLNEKLIGFLRDNGFGYLKVDYNDNIGIGCDHPDSFGEGLRHQVNGIHATFKRIREGVEEIVIENCSSGGHRLEPSMMALTSMSSFSDAHESRNIPVIARQLHYLMPPRQSQIWAVLYPEDSAERTMYSLTSTLYGRMCLSGPVHDLTDAQMETVKASVSFYQAAASVIKEGKTQFLGKTPLNWGYPNGWQGIWRESPDGKKALLVIHTFEGLPAKDLSITLPKSACRKLRLSLHDGTTKGPRLHGDTLTLPKGADFRGYAFLFEQ